MQQYMCLVIVFKLILQTDLATLVIKRTSDQTHYTHIYTQLTLTHRPNETQPSVQRPLKPGSDYGLHKLWREFVFIIIIFFLTKAECTVTYRGKTHIRAHISCTNAKLTIFNHNIETAVWFTSGQVNAYPTAARAALIKSPLAQIRQAASCCSSSQLASLKKKQCSFC